MTAPVCAWCGDPIAGRVVRAMHPNCYRKGLRHGVVEAIQPRRRDPVPDPLDAAVDAIVAAKAPARSGAEVGGGGAWDARPGGQTDSTGSRPKGQ